MPPEELVLGDERETILRWAVYIYGIEAQMNMMIEEMSELTKALCKLHRTELETPESKVVKQNIIEEMADVQIMLDQMRIIFGDTSKAEASKVARLRNRLLARSGREEEK